MTRYLLALCAIILGVACLPDDTAAWQAAVAAAAFGLGAVLWWTA